MWDHVNLGVVRRKRKIPSIFAQVPFTLGRTIRLLLLNPLHFRHTDLFSYVSLAPDCLGEFETFPRRNSTHNLIED